MSTALQRIELPAEVRAVIVAEYLNRSAGEPGTLAWFVERYRDHLRTRVSVDDYSPRRLKGTLAYIASFLRFKYWEDRSPVELGRLPIEAARQAHLTSWLLANYQHWKKGSTRADAVGAVVGCFNFLEECELIGVNPFHRPKSFKFPRSHYRAMRKQHYRDIMRAARRGPREFRLLFFAAWHAGVRLIEFRQLEPQEIDFARGVIRIPPSKHKTGRRTGAERILGVGPRLLAVLRSLVERMEPGQKYVFRTPRGGHWTKDNLGRYYARFRAIAGVPIDIKMCSVRHGFAVRLLADGVTSAKAVADQLGHSGTRMVDSIYGAETRHDANLVRELAARAERGARRA